MSAADLVPISVGPTVDRSAVLRATVRSEAALVHRVLGYAPERKYDGTNPGTIPNTAAPATRTVGGGSRLGQIYRPEGPSLRVDVAACLLVSDRIRERASICLQAIFLVPEYEPFT
jgi:hypothetical protein